MRVLENILTQIFLLHQPSKNTKHPVGISEGA
jgi:hypothetical protein